MTCNSTKLSSWLVRGAFLWVFMYVAVPPLSQVAMEEGKPELDTMTITARQDARRSGKEDAGHSLFLEGCLFGFYGERNSKKKKGVL